MKKLGAKKFCLIWQRKNVTVKVNVNIVNMWESANQSLELTIKERMLQLQLLKLQWKSVNQSLKQLSNQFLIFIQKFGQYTYSFMKLNAQIIIIFSVKRSNILIIIYSNFTYFDKR